MFTISFNGLPALNAGTLTAGICTTSPVRGLRPERAALSRTKKLPKPIKVTVSPFANASFTESKNAFTAAAESLIVKPDFLAMLSTN